MAAVRQGEDVLVCAHPSDCKVLAPLEGHPGMYISSPNAAYIPQLPLHHESQLLRFHADGMLGMYELYKWPQGYDQAEPHGMAAPVNPLLAALSEDRAALAAWDTAGDEGPSRLPPWKDDMLPWREPAMSGFQVATTVAAGDVGTLPASDLQALDAATAEVIKRLQDWCTYKFRAHSEDTPQVAASKKARVAFVRRRARCLERAVCRLKDTPMTKYDTLLWWREAQRLLLELRGWHQYEAVIVPAIQDPRVEAKGVLPVRGAITTRPNLVADLHRLGVPVWEIRAEHTLTDRTVIYKVSVLAFGIGCAYWGCRSSTRSPRARRSACRRVSVRRMAIQPPPGDTRTRLIRCRRTSPPSCVVSASPVSRAWLEWPYTIAT